MTDYRYCVMLPEMRTIPVRQFQLHAKDYLKELPIILTIYNKPVAVVSPYRGQEATVNPTPKPK